eukprot:4012178-Lingulodinium_polyedra.AAC.1
MHFLPVPLGLSALPEELGAPHGVPPLVGLKLFREFFEVVASGAVRQFRGLLAQCAVKLHVAAA